MGQTKVIDNDKSTRRQSWIPVSPLFSSLFSSSPPCKKTIHRSQSLNQHPQRPALAVRQYSHTMDKSRSTSFIKDEKPVQRPCLKKSSTLATILNKAKRCSPVTVEYRQEEVDLHQPVQFMDVDEYEADKSQLRNDFMNLAFTEEFRSTVDFTKLEQGRILDVGCGSGAWCIDMANKYPTIQVIGIDNEDWFPDPSCIPTNCQLLHTNILNALSSQFDLSSFDFIHIRLMALVFTRQQYDLATRYCWNLLKPGATLELLEMDIEMCSAGPVTRRINHQVMTVAEHYGFGSTLAKRLADYIPMDDCLNLMQKYQSLPMGLWGGRLGVLFRDELMDTHRRCQTVVCDYFSKSRDAFASDVASACREMGQYHTFANFHFLTVNKRPIM